MPGCDTFAGTCCCGENNALPTEELSFVFFMVFSVFCCPFSFIVCVAWRVCPSSCFHGICHLQVSAFLAIDAFTLVFIRCIAPLFFIVCCVLSGFLSPYSTYPFQASFMVFSAPNLVFIAHVAFSLKFWHFLLFYEFYSVCRPLIFRTFYGVSVFFLEACSFEYPVVCTFKSTFVVNYIFFPEQLRSR